LTGISVPLVLIFVYGVSGLLSGLGGAMSASRLYSAQGQLGIGYELDAIAAVILGSTSFSVRNWDSFWDTDWRIDYRSPQQWTDFDERLVLLAIGHQRSCHYPCGDTRQIADTRQSPVGSAPDVDCR
jgi:hypothetical protein